ncbi:hypothetical protein KUCAC02_035939 [Chaenocephalus aceratus]|nr:hypothetical protein KUCAC02_035939 [Chaenocephalus aceratus]
MSSGWHHAPLVSEDGMQRMLFQKAQTHIARPSLITGEVSADISGPLLGAGRTTTVRRALGLIIRTVPSELWDSSFGQSHQSFGTHHSDSPIRADSSAA